MFHAMRIPPAVVLWMAVSVCSVSAQPGDDALFTRTEGVVYGEKVGSLGEKLGLLLTMDVFEPKQDRNGKAVIFVVSGGWFSGRAVIVPALPREFLNRGYTVFAVVHGTQPKFTIPEILGDLHRAVRFIRFNAEQYKIDPDKIGIYGGSAGGHLSLMQGSAGKEGDANAQDPVERVSSRVQAVACFFPPTDFLNYGKPGEEALGNGILANFAAPFDFQEFNKETKRFERIADRSKVREIGVQISPLTHVSADDPPTLIVHGDADKLVPMQQAEIFVAKMKEAGATAELLVKPGAAHGWAGMEADRQKMADWFDKHLK